VRVFCVRGKAGILLMLLLLVANLELARGELYHFFLLPSLRIDLVAPEEAKIGGDVKITITIRPSTKIYVEYFTVTLGDPSSPMYQETLLYQQYMQGDYTKTIVVKAQSYGRIPCIIKVSYVTGKEAGPVFERKYEEEFWVYPTLVASSTRQELESIASEYERLKSDYDRLSSSYSALWSECERLKGQAVQNTILLAALVILVAAFIAVAGYALHLEREIRRIRAGAAR
jgi:hypothetical protein